MANVVSYLLAAALGMAGGWLVKRRDTGEGARHAGDRVESNRPKNGTDLLAAFVAASDPVTTTDERFAALRKSMAFSADPAAAFHKRFAEMEAGIGRWDDERRQMELAVLFGRWVDSDPKAALAFLAESSAAGGLASRLADACLWRVAKNAMEENGVRAFVSVLPDNPDLVMLTSRSVFEDVAKRGSLADLAWLKANAPGYFADRSAGKNLAREWPVERRDELLAALDPHDAAAAVAGIMGRMEGAGGEWVLEKLRSGGFPQEVVREMAAGDLGEYFRSINGVSIEQRLEIMGLLGTLGNIGEDRAKNEMIFNSIRNRFFGRETDDSLYGLRHGTLTAGEVLARAVETMPDPGKHTGEYNSQMFRTMAEENLPAAMELLSGMPPQQQEKEKALAARWWFRDADPQDFFNLVQDLNATGDGATKAMMQDAWNDKSRAYLDRYGASYLEWVRALPDGVDRTQALRSVAASGSNPRLAAQARNLLEKKP